VSGQLAADQAARIVEFEKITSENKELQTSLTEARQEITTNALLIKDSDQRVAVAEQKASGLTDKTNDLKTALDEALEKIKK
jgi:chromosome segregation ATPase